MIRLQGIPAYLIAEVWPLIVPFAKRMEEKFVDDWPISETLRQALDGRLLIWLVTDDERIIAAGGTEVQRTASGKMVLAIRWLAGNDHAKWLHLLPEIEEYGRSCGCTELHIQPGSRVGWEKATKDHGYKAERMIRLRKELR